MTFSSNNIEIKEQSIVSPILNPGEHLVTLHKMELSTLPYDAEKRQITLLVEGPAITDFVGLPIDKDVPSKGNYEGQIANVKHNRYDFGTYTTKTGKTIERDTQIFNWVNNFAFHIGKLEELKNANINTSTIEEYVDEANKVLRKSKLWITLAGQEYKNTKGYISYRLFVAKGDKFTQPYAEGTLERPTNLVQFNVQEHIIKYIEPSDNISGDYPPSDMTMPVMNMNGFGDTTNAPIMDFKMA